VNKLKFGIPKGSLEKATTDLFAKAGWMIKTSSRNYFPTVDDPHLSCAIIRAQEMAHYVEEGVLDAAITGKDWIVESGSDVVEVQEMIYSKESPRPARWVLVVTEDSPIQRIEDLQGKKIATELVSFTKRYFAERGIQVKVEFSWGTTEAKVVEGLADAIVDVTETGSTIRAHHLRIVHELMQSTPPHRQQRVWQDPWKRRKSSRLPPCSRPPWADRMVGLKMNVPHKDLEPIIAILPASMPPPWPPYTIATGTRWRSWCGKRWYGNSSQLLKKGRRDYQYALNKVI
jgi:ATP phosphoribosyltransferase